MSLGFGVCALGKEGMTDVVEEEVFFGIGGNWGWEKVGGGGARDWEGEGSGEEVDWGLWWLRFGDLLVELRSLVGGWELVLLCLVVLPLEGLASLWVRWLLVVVGWWERLSVLGRALCVL